MAIYQFKTADVLPNTIINTVFVHNGHSYRIIDLTKSWGEPPILLGYVKVQNEVGEFSEMLIKCRKEFVGILWNISIEESIRR